jgi:O-antigen/teichoic acid export membrane protein
MDQLSQAEAPRDTPRGIRYRLISGIGAQSFAQLLRIGQQFIVVPLFIHAWGSAAYQDWLVIFSATTFLILLDLGTVVYFGNRMLFLWSRGATQDFDHTIKLAIGSLAALLLAAALVLTPIALTVGWKATLGIHELSSSALNFALLFFALSAIPRIFFNLLLTVYSARGELHRSNNAWSAYFIAQTAAVVTALAFKASILQVAFVMMVSDFLAALLVAADQYHRYKGMRFAVGLPSRAELADSTSKSPFYLVNPLTLLALLHGPIVILGTLGSVPGALVTFSVLRTLTGLARQLPFQLAIGFGVEMARHSARQDPVTLRKIYINAGRFVSGLIGLLGGMLLVVAEPFVRLWTHNQVAYDGMLVAMFIAATLCAGPAQPAMALLTYSNRPRPVAVALLCQCAAGLTLCAALTPRFGAHGAQASLWLTEFMAVGLCLPYAASRKVGVPFASYLIQSYGAGVLAFGTSYLIAHGLASLLGMRGLLGLVEVGAGWGAAVAAIGAIAFYLVRVRRPALLGRGPARIRHHPSGLNT